MSETKESNKAGKPKPSTHLVNLLQHAVGTINTANETIAAERVAMLQKKYPDTTADELVEKLIKSKCLQTGAIGAVTSSAAIIPELGTFVALTFGLAADLSMTLKLQTELVLEIINVYQHELSLAEKRNIVMLITGITFGSNQLLSKASVEIAEKATESLEEKFVAKAIPVLGIAASAGINILSTYVIGRRAQAYFQRGPEALDDWGENARALTGIDERKVSTWLAEAIENSWDLASSYFQNVAGSLIVLGKAGSELIVVGTGETGGTLINLSRSAGRNILTGAGQARSLIARLRRQQRQKSTDET